MYWIKTMHLLLTIAAIVFFSCVSIHAQDSTELPESRHILIVNKTHETLKEVNIGDKVRLKLLDASKVKGHITSIDSTSFTVDNLVIYLDAINKISTTKRGEQLLGGALAAGGLVSFALAFSNERTFEAIALYGIMGIGLTSVGVVMMIPGYHNIGKSKFLLISSKPNDLNNDPLSHTTLR